jgi:uncharacterized protein (DUF1499 family)
MRKLLVRLVVLAVLPAAFYAFTTWPLLNDVETGKTPEYPDLQPREYAAGPDVVARAVKAVLSHQAHWKLVGEGKGSVGVTLQALHTTPVVPFESEVTIRIRREGGRTRVSVRSQSSAAKLDLGQNARNIRELLGALDRELR